MIAAETEDASRGFPRSPVTGSARVSLVDRISVADVIAAYRGIGIDLGSMLDGLHRVHVFRCDDTGYRFYYPYELAADSAFYARLQSDTGYYATWRWEHGQAVAALGDSGRILEIGSGTGNFLACLRDEFGKDVVGLELNSRALDIARSRGLNVVGQRVEDFADGRIGEFDAVCTFQVLEHVPDVRSFLRATCSVLKPGGRLIVGVPNNHPYPYKFDRLHALNLPPHHMGLWHRDSLTRLCEFFPLSLLAMREQPLEDVGYFWSVYLAHLRGKRSPLYYFLARAPWRVTRVLQSSVKRWVYGLNIMAIYRRDAL